MNNNDDPEIVIKLPLTAVQTIVQHLYLGLYVGNPVFSIVNAIFEQATPQMNLAVSGAAPSRTVSADDPAKPSGAERVN